MSSHVVRSDNCTPACCPAFSTHLRHRVRWAAIRFLYSPTEQNRSVMLALRDAHICDHTTRPHPQADIQPEEQIAWPSTK